MGMLRIWIFSFVHRDLISQGYSMARKDQLQTALKEDPDTRASRTRGISYTSITVVAS